MAYHLSMAVLSDWLPKLNPPVGGNGFSKPYGERLKLDLEVEPSESLSSVYRRAIDQLQPQVSPDSPSHPEDLLAALYWIWFYEPQDEEEDGFARKRYERPEDLILIDEQGHARWHASAEQIRYDEIVRAAERGLLRGDPLRPYLAFLQPQGGGELKATWEAVQIAWKVLEALLVARGGVALGAEANRRLLDRLRGRRVAEAHSVEWMQQGGDPHSVRRTFDRKPWSPEDLRIVMNVATTEDAERLLALFGHDPTASGEYEISETEEARLLRLAEDDAFETFVRGSGFSESQIEGRLKRLLDTGERPSL
jgi:hypothetical protein